MYKKEIMYKIRRLKLINYLPIYSVMKLKELEISWCDSEHPITLILGANGSCKTVLMTELTPKVTESITNRERSKIIPDKDGRKEIDVENVNTGIIYYCTIEFLKNLTRCSIIKNNVELNPTAQVSSYHRILEEELGLRNNYAHIGYISHSVTSIIDMKPAKRSEYMTTWLPDVTDYIQVFKTGQSKYNLIDRTLKEYNKELVKIDQYDDVSIKQRRSHLAELDNNLKEIYEKRGTLNAYYSKIPENLTPDRVKENIDIYKDNVTELNEMAKILENLYTTLQESGGRNQIIETIHASDKELQRHKILLNHMSNEISVHQNRVQELNSRQSVQSNQSLPDLRHHIEYLKQELMDLNQSCSDVEADHQAFIECRDFIDDIYVANLQNFIDSLLQHHDILEQFQSYFNWFDRLFYNEIQRDEANIQKIEAIITELQNKIYALEHSTIDPHLLNNQPDYCRNCPISQEICHYIHPEQKITENTEKLAEQKKQKQRCRDSLEKIQSEYDGMRKARYHLDLFNHFLIQSKEFIAHLPVLFVEFFKSDIKDIANRLSPMLFKLKQYRDYSSYVSRIRTCQSSLANAQNTEKLLSMELNFDSELKALMQSLDTLKTQYSQTRNAKENIEKKLEEHRSALMGAESYQAQLDIYHRLKDQVMKEKTIVSQLNLILYYKQHLSQLLNYLREQEFNLIEEKKSSNEALQKMETDIALKNQLTDKIKALNSNLKQLKIMLEIWSPRTGIPSLFINMFLNNVKNRANEYLDKLWEDQLQIETFETKERDFPISIIKDGETIIPDAGVCSEGERSTISIAVSMAMIMEIMSDSGYNVLRLDEVDSPFDDYRRRTFIEILLERLKEIHCHHCFIITHNNEFDSVESDVILLPGHKYISTNLSNKNILLRID